MDEVAVDAGAETTETPSEVTAPAESETPSVDAQAETEGGDAPAGGQEVDPLTQYLQSKGIKPEDRTALHDLLRKRDNDNGTLSKRIKDLETQLTQRAAPAKPAEPEPEPEPHPDIKGLDEYISATKAKLDALPQKEASLVKDVWSIEREIAKAEARFEAADDIDKPKRELELERLRAARDAKAAQLENLPEIRERYEIDLRRSERDRKFAAQAIEAEESARQEAGARHKEWESGFVSEVDSLIPRFADEFKLPADAALRGEMAEDVRNALTIELWRRADANINEVNVQELLRGCVEKWAKKHGLVQAAKLAQVSKEKAPVAGRPNGAPQRTAPSPNTPERQLSKYEQMELERAARLKKMAALGL